MPKAERVAIINKIEELRNSKVITYITSYRKGLEVMMAMDSIRKVYEHLKLIKTEPKLQNIDLFIVSNGGDGTVPWRLVTLLREYCESFNTLITYRAFSAATLTSLGADKIIMHPMGMLGPTDPTVQNAFNPTNEKSGERLGISVEDVTAYISLIKEDAGITHQEELVQALNILAQKVHPLALGNVKRSLSQSKMMAQKLLSLHMNQAQHNHAINDIVENLTSKLYYHGHPINRTEARDQIGLRNIEFADGELEENMWKLFLDYEAEIKSEEPFNMQMEFMAANPGLLPMTPATNNLNVKTTFIETTERTDVYQMSLNLSGQKDNNGTITVTGNITSQGWTTE